MTSEPSKALTRSGDEVYNDAALLSLAMDDRELANELVRIFLDEVPKHLDALTAAVASGDAPSVLAAAHALKGSAATVTASRVAAAAQVLETCGGSADLINAPQLLEDLKGSLRELNARLTVL
ncbi:MAG: Hpt domain-containing protein [bacterium]